VDVTFAKTLALEDKRRRHEELFARVDEIFPRLFAEPGLLKCELEASVLKTAKSGAYAAFLIRLGHNIEECTKDETAVTHTAASGTRALIVTDFLSFLRKWHKSMPTKDLRKWTNFCDHYISVRFQVEGC